MSNNLTAQQAGGIAEMMNNGDMLDRMMKLAEIMATGKATLPREYRDSPGDCLAVVMQAHQWRMNPFAVAQKTYFINGVIGYEAQLVNSVITSLAPTKDRIHYEWYGDWSKVIGKFNIKKNQAGKQYREPAWDMADEVGLGIRVWATLKGEDEPRVLDLLLAQARVRNSPLWADDPKQQLAYLGVKRWARLYCPDVILGVYTKDEIEEEREVDATAETSGPARPRSRGQTLRDRLHPKDPEPEPEKEVGSTADRIAQAIAHAATIAELDPIKGYIRSMPNGEDKKALKKAWLEREEAIKAAGAGVNTDTGEIEEDGPLTDLALALREAGDAEELAALWPGIERMDPSPLRQRAIIMYEQREADLSAAESA